MYNFIKNWVSTGDFLLFQSLIGNVQLMSIAVTAMVMSLSFNPS